MSFDTMHEGSSTQPSPTHHQAEHCLSTAIARKRHENTRFSSGLHTPSPIASEPNSPTTLGQFSSTTNPTSPVPSAMVFEALVMDMLLDSVMANLFPLSNQESCLRILSIPSSVSNCAYKKIVPRILIGHCLDEKSQINAHITHIIQPHQMVTPGYSEDHWDASSSMPFYNYSNAQNSQGAVTESREYFSIQTRAFSQLNLPSSSLSPPNLSPPLSPTFNITSGSIHHHNSTFPIPSYPGLSSNIFNSFSFSPPVSTNIAQVVPPNSCHYILSLYSIPSHSIPAFEPMIASRYKELTPGGSLIICYPTSLALYSNFILPCLDLTLHQMLALSLINTHDCESVSQLPTVPIPSYPEQLSYLSGLPNAEIVQATEMVGVETSDWARCWLMEDIQWIKSALSDNSSIICRLVDGLSRNLRWYSPGVSDFAMFVVKKKSDNKY